MLETVKTIRAAWPMLTRAIRSGQILRPQCELVDPDPDIHSAYDVQIPMSEGYALTCSIFSSNAARAEGRAMPVVMCAHPYDNRKTPARGNTPLGGPPQQYRLIPQAEGTPRFSTLTSWEAPDPNFWVPAGYIQVNVNLPGYADSGGPGSVISAHQGKCYREAISWVAAQPWCDGNVGLNGVSYLAISQYFAASAPEGDVPEALKCICPWEGVTDIYHDFACGGGVADTAFLDFWWHTEVKESLNTPIEDFLKTEEAVGSAMIAKRPLYDAYWRGKAPDLAEIRVPLMVCGSFSDHELHTMGSFRAFERAGSARKWVYTHRSGKWTTYYAPDVQALTKDFMDHFLKGAENRFTDLPPVRLEVRSDRDQVHEVRWEEDWPLPRTSYVPLHLTADGLERQQPEAEGEVTYATQGGKAIFDHVFTEDTELSGYMKLKLWVEVRPNGTLARQPDDMILCIYVDKLDGAGNVIRFNGSVGTTDDVMTRGYVRVSRRELDADASTDWLPVFTGSSVRPLTAGEIVPVEVPLRPSSTFFRAGEGIRLTVSPTDYCHAPIFGKDTSANEGRHVLHHGGTYDAHLLVPVIP
ncbi:MAG: CocE/NonD family hydrolase [Pseudomonadota bacterium]